MRPITGKQAFIHLAESMNVPTHMHDIIGNYVFDYIPPGGFLTALLENNLVKTFLRADKENKAHIYDWVVFLDHDVPKECWGSPEKVKAWLQIPMDLHAADRCQGPNLCSYCPSVDEDAHKDF